MAIFRCNSCGHVREVGNDYVGKSVKCPKCENVATIHDTVSFIHALIKRYLAQSSALQELQNSSTAKPAAREEVRAVVFDDIDINNTNIFTRKSNLSPIVGWFEKRNIKVQMSPDAVDTTGFFDEIALLLGNNFEVLKVVSNQIKYVQNKGYTNVKIDLAKKNNKEIQQILSFCRSLYEYSFVAKNYYQKKEKIIRLTLQTAPKIRSFFNGVWMEWFTLMELLDFFRQRKMLPACSRSLEIEFSGGKTNELDIFFLTENTIPICIECKTGEFRQDIDKYLSLRKRIGLEKNQFIVCVFGLSPEQATGMTSMYDVTFVNENTLIDHVKTVV